MPNNTVSDWSTTPALNTEVGGVDLNENSMRPRDVNNAIRTVMAQVATGIDNSEFGGVPQFHPATAAGPAALDFAEDTDNGTNKVTLQAPAALSADRTLTLPDASGTLLLGALGSTDSRLVRTDGTGGSTAQGSAVTVDDSGNMSGVGTLGVGAITTTGLLTTNGQIKFPATQNPSSDPNTLDDYEEGTFTVTWTAVTTNPAIGNGTVVADYVKVGTLVRYALRMNFGSTTTFGSGVWMFSLPFDAAAANDMGSVFAFDAGTANRVGASAISSTTTLRLVSDNTTNNWQSNIPFTWSGADNDRFQTTIVYKAAA
jgi:hypothetical protein